MPTRPRPEGCCAPRNVAPLRAEARERLVAAFKALSDPTRLEIVRLVAAQDSAVCVCDIVDRFDLSQPTISHHLKVLREAELLEMTRRGVWAFYELDRRGREVLDDIAAFTPG